MMNDSLPSEVLGNLIEGITADFRSCAAADVPYRIRSRLKCATAKPALLLESADLLLRQLRCSPVPRFLVREAQSRYTLQLFCWAPGFGNLPHLHTNWTVSAVLSGSILLKKSAISKVDCEASTPLLVSAGDVGMLKPPQYHCLANPSISEAAVTFHVFPVERKNSLEASEMNPHARRIDDAGVLALVKVAVQSKGPLSLSILRNAFEVSGPQIKLEVVKRLAQFEPREAVRLGGILAHQVGGADGERLMTVLSKFEGESSTTDLNR